MPLAKFEFKPGIDKQLTETGAGELSEFVDCDFVRFRYGLPEKIGGWVQAYTANALLGAPRAQKSYTSNSAVKFDAIGTNKKFYIFDATNGTMNDETPQSKGTRGKAAVISTTGTFTSSNGSALVTCVCASHGASVGNFVTISAVASLADTGYSASDFTTNPFEITAVVNSNSFKITMSAVESGSGMSTTGNATFTIQVNIGNYTSSLGFGWGAGPWSDSTWGSPRPTSVDIDAGNWSIDNYGEDVVATLYNGGTYYFDTSAFEGGGTDPLINLIDYNTGTDAYSLNVNAATMPGTARFSIISTPDRHLILFGSETTIGTSATQDPMFVRWSDQESIGDFVPTQTNTAGSQKLSDGAEIRAAIRSRGQILIWTDTAMHTMQFQGPPFTFGFEQKGRQCGCIGQHAAVDIDGIAYWMSNTGFYAFDGTVQALPCSVQDHVFNNIRLVPEIYAGVNSDFHEITWFYPTATSDIIDRCVTYNYMDKVWYNGTLDRTTWIDRGVFNFPYATNFLPTSTVAATPTVQGVTPGRSYLYAQENGDDDDGSAITASLTSGDFMLDAGENLFSISRFIPDFKNMTGTVSFTIQLRNYPADDKTSSSLGPFTLTPTTTKKDCRARARQGAIKIESSATGDAWRFGTLRLDLKQSGLR